MLAHLLDHANELRESPVQLVQDAVEEGRRHVFVHAQQLGHVLLQQQRWTRLCTNHTRAHVVTSGAATLHHTKAEQLCGAAEAERGGARVEVRGAEEEQRLRRRRRSSSTELLHVLGRAGISVEGRLVSN